MGPIDLQCERSTVEFRQVLSKRPLARASNACPRRSGRADDASRRLGMSVASSALDLGHVEAGRFSRSTADCNFSSHITVAVDKFMEGGAGDAGR